MGGALDEKHNLQRPRLQTSTNPGWPVQLGATVMLVIYNGGQRMPEATLGIVCVLEGKCCMCYREHIMHMYMCYCECVCVHARSATYGHLH